jgi:uncharacterized protein involved in outer membrane biogenesis
MRIKLKHVAFTLLGLAAVASAAAASVVAYVQNNDMRAWATWGAKQAGYDVTFGGPVEIKLWPTLVVKARDIDAKALQGTGSIAQIEALALQADWGSGLAPWNGIQLRAIEAKNPTLTLIRDAQGVANWAPAATAQTSTPASSTDAESPLQTLTEQGGVLASVRLAIANLNLDYADAQSGQKVAVKAMNIGARTSGTVAITTLKGTINAQLLEGELVADVANFADIPLKARLEGAGAALALEGRVTTAHNGKAGFAGLINARSGDVKATLKTLMGTAPAQAPNSPASVTGDVVLAPENIVLRNFSARLGELLQARGDIDVKLGKNPTGNGQLTVQGVNLRALAELLGGTTQPLLPAKPFNLQGKLAGEQSIQVQDLTFNIEPVLRITGAMDITPRAGMQPDINATLNLASANFAELLSALGQTMQAPRSGLQAVLKVQGKGGVYTLAQADAELTDTATLKATGTIDTSGATPKIEIETTVQGTDMAKAAAGFGVAQVPSSGFSLRAKVRGSGPYELEGLTINLPGLVQALANLSIQTGTPMNIGGDINITQLDATKLGYCGVSGGGSGGGQSGGSGASSATPWSDEVLDLSVLRTFGLNLKLNASGIRCADVPLESVAMQLRNTPSQLDVENLKLNLAKSAGAIEGKLTLMHAGKPQLNTALALKNVHPEAFAASLAERGVRLPLSGGLELATQGETSRRLAQNLGGRVALKAEQGRLPYTDMLGNVVALERLLQGSAALPTNGDGTVDDLGVVLVFRQGVGTFEELKVATGNGSMALNGTGQIDLPNWTIDVMLTPQLATSSGLAIPISVRGPLTSPAIGADPAYTQRLTKRLATEGLKAALGLDKEDAKGLGGALNDVLGGKGLSAEGVGNLLNAFGPKAKPSPTTPAPEATPAAAPTEAAPEAAPETQAPAQPAATNPLEQALPGLINGVLGQ